MNMISTIGMRPCDVQLEAIRAEFGAVMAARILDAEAVDFLWEARMCERYLGQCVDVIFDEEDAAEEVSRIAFLSDFDGAWHAGICLVNGEGNVVELLWRRQFESILEAQMAFDRAC